MQELSAHPVVDGTRLALIVAQQEALAIAPAAESRVLKSVI
jgi:hypothetical protein